MELLGLCPESSEELKMSDFEGRFIDLGQRFQGLGRTPLFGQKDLGELQPYQGRLLGKTRQVEWRRCMGIEPTGRTRYVRPDGFEDRGHHQVYKHLR